MANPESEVDPSLIPPLDPSLLVLSDTEKAFLQEVISPDEDEIRARLLEVQKIAYEKYPYPCIRGFHFVNQFMAANSVYSSVLAAGKAGNTLFLDLGCMMGTDVRKLVHDGYPASRVLGCDLRQEYIDLGYTLYRDQDSCPIRFIASNIFDLPLTPPHSISGVAAASSVEVDLKSITDLSQLYGALTHIYTGALFHLFDEETQYGLAVRLAHLLRKTPGAVIFGRHQGLDKEAYIDDHLSRKRYGHSPQSWKTLWDKVFREVGGEDVARRVVVQADLTEGFSCHIFNGRHRSQMLYWSVQLM